MSTLLERLLPSIDARAWAIRRGCRMGLCYIVRNSDLRGVEKDCLRRLIDSSALLYRYGTGFATSALVARGRIDPSMCAPFIGGGPEVTFSTLDDAGLAWVADAWRDWAIDIVRDVQHELYGQ